MTPPAFFWKETAPTEQEVALVNVVLDAHARSAFRDNVSSIAAVNTFAGSKNYPNSIAAALMTLGKVHAPIAEAMHFLGQPDPVGEAQRRISRKQRVFGWGNAFAKGKPDELWKEVEDRLAQDFSEMHGKLADVTKALHKAGKDIYPNPAAYTAAAALVLGIPPAFAPWLFIEGRLTAWTGLLLKCAK